MATAYSTPAWPIADEGGTLSSPGVPAMPPNWVQRDRLDQLVDDAAQHRLSVVTGPPGSGKTVLLSGWAQHCPHGDTAWVSLEDMDNEPLWFWQHLVVALRGVDSSLGCEVLEALQQAGDIRMELRNCFLRDIRHIQPTVVIIDDFQVITNPEIIESVDYLVRHLPSHVRIVLASRQVPSFASHRLRVSGELAEIRESDLHFNIDEAAALCASAADRPLARDAIEALTERTEGWAAGLQLAALALADQDDPSEFARRFTGDSHLVAEYLTSEVLEGQPPDVVRFLLETSVLDAMTFELCQQVTERPDARQVLESLSSRHLFVIRLDPTDRWYRYHHLFADLLRHRLELEEPSVARRAHLKAAAWFKRNGDDHTAMHHFVRAGAYDEAFALGESTVIRQFSGGVLRGSEILLPGELPEDYFEQDPYRMYTLAAALLCAIRPADAASWLRRLALAIPDRPERELFQWRAEILWTIHDGLLTNASGVLHHYRRATELLASTRREDLSLLRHDGARSAYLDTVDGAIFAQLPVLAAHAHIWLGQAESAREVLDTCCRYEDDSDNLAYMGVLATLAFRQGRLRDACMLARKALDEAGRQHRSGAVATLDARVALASVLFEEDDLDAAEKQLEHSLNLCRRTAQTRWISAIECDLVQVMLAQGRHREALDRLCRFREAEPHDPAPHRLLQKVDRVEVRCRLALGDLEGAVLILRYLAPELQTAELLASIDLCAARPDRAVARLTAFLDRPTAVGVDIERLTLLARAQLQLGDRRRADDALRRAIELGRPERYIRVFLDGARELLPLLRGIAGTYPDAYVAELLSHAERDDISLAADSAPGALEPLTDRERELLSYLPSHLSQHEIADVTYISLNTVKTHIKGVYRKLGAKSRSEAVALAREHGLL